MIIKLEEKFATGLASVIGKRDYDQVLLKMSQLWNRVDSLSVGDSYNKRGEIKSDSRYIRYQSGNRVQSLTHSGDAGLNRISGYDINVMNVGLDKLDYKIVKPSFNALYDLENNQVLAVKVKTEYSHTFILFYRKDLESDTLDGIYKYGNDTIMVTNSVGKRVKKTDPTTKEYMQCAEYAILFTAPEESANRFDVHKDRLVNRKDAYNADRDVRRLVDYKLDDTKKRTREPVKYQKPNGNRLFLDKSGYVVDQDRYINMLDQTSLSDASKKDFEECVNKFEEVKKVYADAIVNTNVKDTKREARDAIESLGRRFRDLYDTMRQMDFLITKLRRPEKYFLNNDEQPKSLGRAEAEVQFKKELKEFNELYTDIVRYVETVKSNKHDEYYDGI